MTLPPNADDNTPGPEPDAVMPGNHGVRIALALLIGVCVALTIGIAETYRDFIQNYLLALRQGDPAAAYEAARSGVLRYALITAGVPGAVGLFLIYAGSRVLTAGCFPYPGMPLPNDVVVQRGAAAARRGRMFLAVGFCTLAAGIWSGWESYRSGSDLVRSAYLEAVLSDQQRQTLW